MTVFQIGFCVPRAATPATIAASCWRIFAHHRKCRQTAAYVRQVLVRSFVGFS